MTIFDRIIDKYIIRNMRTEKEMMDLLLGFGRNDKRIRAVCMEGSRTNPNAPKDCFQDYDISYFVTEMDSFMTDDRWLDIFGERIIMQKPEAMTLFPPDLGGWFSYLMLFTDGNRIDLTLIPLTDIQKYIEGEKGLSVLLLDKDNLFPQLPAPADTYYHVRKPTATEFSDCCNEFWWVTTYIAKGLARKEILYAADHLDRFVRLELLRILSWKAGIRTNFSVSVGKNYKYIEKYLEPDEWEKLLSTYDCSTYENCGKALFVTTALFGKTAAWVAESMGFTYPAAEYLKVEEYLHTVRW